VDAEAMAVILACGVRIEIIEMVAQGERTTGQIAGALGITLPHASNHLKKLFEAHLVSWRREGKNVYYRLDEHARVAARGDKVRIRIDDGDSIALDLWMRTPLPEIKVSAARPRADRTTRPSRPPSAP
jgi:DNA-binding transcriptional ArsR family regulator